MSLVKYRLKEVAADFDPDQAKEVFDLPENEVPVMLLDLGYASEEAAGQPLPNHASRKELSETVKYI